MMPGQLAVTSLFNELIIYSMIIIEKYNLFYYEFRNKKIENVSCKDHITIRNTSRTVESSAFAACCNHDCSARRL